VQIYALLGFSAVGEDHTPLPVELTQRRILEALVYEDGVARSAEEIRRRAQLADANSVGQGLSRLRASWSKILGPSARDIFPEARASKGYRIHVDRHDIDVWHVEDLQRTVREGFVASNPSQDWDALGQVLLASEAVWTQAEERNRQHPTALAEPASELGKRVAQLSVRRLENRKRWIETTVRTAQRNDLALPLLETWLTNTESPSRPDISLWRLWIEAKAEVPGTSAADLDQVVEDARTAGLDIGVLEAVRRTAVTRLSPGNTATPRPMLKRLSLADADGHLLVDLTKSPTRPPIAGLELNIRSSFVGRVAELEQLVRAGVQALRDRTGHLITVSGEPGVGKSRLVAEIVSLIDANDKIEVSWFVGRCLPQGKGVTCWALGEIVKTIAGVRPHDAPEAAVAKLEECLLRAHIDVQEIPELVRHLAPLVGGAGGTASGDTERFYAWGRALGAIGTARPIALIFEDLHWADDMLLEFLDSLTEQGSPSSLLVIATGRPEFLTSTQGWAGGGRSASTLALSRLADSETTGLLESFRTADDQALSVEVRQAIVERCGGNPLFAEELARMVELSGPEAIHGLPRLVELVVAARLDHLSDDAAKVAYAAATIGRVFWSGAIEAVEAVPAPALRNALAELVRADLVQRSWSSSFTSQLEYTFWHAIVRDVAAARLNPRDLARVHLRTAAWLRSVSLNRLSDVADELARNYQVVLSLGEELPQDSLDHAIEAFQLAGQRALILDRQRAATYFESALSITPKDHHQRGPLLADHAGCLANPLEISRCEEVCRAALDELETSSDELSRARVMASFAINVSNRSDLRGAIKLFEESFAGLQLGPHDEYMAHKCVTLFLLGSVGERERVLGMLDECWAWCQDAVTAGRSIDVTAAVAYAWLVNPQEALDWFTSTLADPTSPLNRSVLVPVALAEIFSGMQGPRAALEILDAAAERYSSRVGAASVWMRGSQVDYLTQVGELTRAIEYTEIALREVGSSSPMYQLQFLGEKLFAQLLASGSVEEKELMQLTDLLTLQPGTHEMILLGLRASAFAHLVRGEIDSLRVVLGEATRIFEARIDRSTALRATIRLAMTRLAHAIGETGLARRMMDTCDPLSPSHEIEQRAHAAYALAADGNYADAAVKLGDVAKSFQAMDFDLDALWIQLHQARFHIKGGQTNVGQLLEKASLERLESFGAFGIHAGVLDGLSLGFADPIFGV
jgi:AAA ATPase domain